MTSDGSVEAHVARLTSGRVVEKIVTRTNVARERIVEILSMYGAEARHGFYLIKPHLPASGKILEVGAGLGMLSSYLCEQGYKVAALEPCVSGFDFFREIRETVLEESNSHMQILPIRAEELNLEQHGEFQLIFSINVLEHIGDLAGAFAGMAAVLSPAGRMWHTCANYLFPYEPHFGVPLVPLFPAATALLLPRRISQSELWRGLNFATWLTVKRLARTNGLRECFQRGTLADAFMRLYSDNEFAARHRGLATEIIDLLKTLRVMSIVGKLPPMISTPMIFTLERRNETSGVAHEPLRDG